MNVSLTPKLAALVAERVRSGRYQSASEVVREALRLLEDVEEVKAVRLQELRKDIAAGLKELDRGRSVSFDRNLADSIKAKGRKALSRGRRRRA